MKTLFTAVGFALLVSACGGELDVEVSPEAEVISDSGASGTAEPKLTHQELQQVLELVRLLGSREIDPAKVPLNIPLQVVERRSYCGPHAVDCHWGAK